MQKEQQQKSKAAVELLQLKYQQFLQKLSKPPRYQYIIGIFISVIYVLIVFNTMIGPYVYMNPKFQCNGTPTPELQACKKLDQCIIINNFTAAYQNKLYCDKQQIRTTIQSVFGFGYMIGKISFPLISDIIGRKICLLIAVFCGIVAMSTQIIGIQYNVEAAMVAGQVIGGIFGSGMYTLSVIYICDFCPPKIRETYLTTVWCIWGFAQMFFYVLYQYLNHWKLYLILILTPAVLIFTLLIFFQIQTPAFALFVKKDENRFKTVLKKVRSYNKFPEEENSQLQRQGKQIIQSVKNEGQTKIHLKQALTKIFFISQNFKTLVCLVLINLSYVFFYYGMQGSMESTGFSFSVNMLFIGITQAIAYLLSGILARKVKRKMGLVLSIILSSVVGLLFLFQFVGDNKVIQTLLVVLARVGSTFVFCLFLIVESQLLAVQIRSTCFAIIDGTGQFGRISGPIVITIMYNLNTPPIIIFSIVFLGLGALPVFFLRQSFKSVNKIDQDQIITQQSQSRKLFIEKQTKN